MPGTNRDIIAKSVNFIELILGTPGKDNLDAETTKDEIKAFQSSLIRFNEDPTFVQARPFMLISTCKSEILAQTDADEVMIDAQSAGLDREFKKIVVNDISMLFFSHKVRGWVDQRISGTDIAYTNMLSNGLVTDDFHFVGFYTASVDRLEAALVEAKALLQITH